MIVLHGIDEVERQVGRDIGPGDWFTVSQDIINLFARATGDYQWIHVDAERAKRELPGGKTIAHGYLLLSLLPRLTAEICRIEHDGPALNYGSNKIRFTQPVPAGSRVRLALTIKAVDRGPSGVRVTMGNALTLESDGRIALIADSIVFFPQGKTPRRRRVARPRDKI